MRFPKELFVTKETDGDGSEWFLTHNSAENAADSSDDGKAAVYVLRNEVRLIKDVKVRITKSR